MRPATAVALNFSGAAKANRNFSRFDDNRHLATALRQLQHPGKSLVVLEHVQVGKRDLATGIGLPGRGCVWSKIFAKDYDFVVHCAALGRDRNFFALSKISVRRRNCK